MRAVSRANSISNIMPCVSSSPPPSKPRTQGSHAHTQTHPHCSTETALQTRKEHITVQHQHLGTHPHAHIEYLAGIACDCFTQAPRLQAQDCRGLILIFELCCRLYCNATGKGCNQVPHHHHPLYILNCILQTAIKLKLLAWPLINMGTAEPCTSTHPYKTYQTDQKQH